MGGSVELETDLRRAARFPMHSFVRVCRFENGGTGQTVTAQGLDISATGMAFVTSQPLAPGLPVHVELPNTGLTARARVRNCGRREWGWRVGVELEGSFA